MEPHDPDRERLLDRVRKGASAYGLPVFTLGQIHDHILSVFDSTFAVTRSMRVLAIIVAFFGIAGALLTLFMERQREFGIYRSLGFFDETGCRDDTPGRSWHGYDQFPHECNRRDNPCADPDKGDQPSQFQLDHLLLPVALALPGVRHHGCSREHGRSCLPRLEDPPHLSPYAAKGGVKGRSMRRTWPVSLLFAIILAMHPGLAAPTATERSEGWRGADTPRTWHFPRDNGAHAAYKTEWWYFTGNLNDDEGGRYGFQLTFFREGVSLNPADPKNPWSVRDLYFAHFAITDVSGKRFDSDERASRAGPGLAGASADHLDVWLLNWRALWKGNHLFLEARNNGAPNES